MDDRELHEVLDTCVAAVRGQLATVTDWHRRGDRPGQYGLDLVADAPAVELLVGAGLGVLSEESGRHHPEREICVVVDPVDGSTNASRRIPWYACSLAAVDEAGVRAASVVNLATDVVYRASRGAGATRDGVSIRAAATTELGDALVLVNGVPPAHLGWAQYRSLGAAALDLCLVAEGAADAYLDCAQGNHGAWDYLGGMLVLAEAGGVIADLDGRDLVVLDHDARRAPIAAATPALAAQLMAAHRTAAQLEAGAVP